MTNQGADRALEKIACGLEVHEAKADGFKRAGLGDFLLTAAKFREVLSELKAKGWDSNTILANVALIFQAILKYGPDLLAIISAIISAIG